MNGETEQQPEASSAPRSASLDHEVIIVGSGFSGIGAAAALLKIDTRDFVILEREQEPGGTWVQSDYPGLEVDMPFFIYSYPFEMKPDWNHVYPTGAELKAYTQHCIEKYDLKPRIRCGATVVAADYHADSNAWSVELADGSTLTSRYLVNATGLLVLPKMPDIKGLESFKGTVVHSANWDHSCDLAGKRVAIIGTGATAIQLIPALAEHVDQLDVYQRTAIWMMPKPNPELSAGLKRALRAVPFLQTLTRWAMNLFVELTMGLGFVRYTRFPWIFKFLEKKLVESIRSQVDDPDVQEKLIPNYSFFCKRPSFSNTFYPTFNRPNVELITEPIDHVSENAVVTESGQAREIDVLVCATGYNVFNRKCSPGYELTGLGGRNLGEYWEDERFQAYEGATVPSFPNLFLYMGPYSAAGASYFTMIDTQSNHMIRCMREARNRGTHYVEVKQQAHDRDFAKINRRRQETVLFGGDCARSNSYYFDAHGDTPNIRPVTGFEHWMNSRLFSLRDYRFERSG